MSASAILKLQKVGFTPEQVEALADFMDDKAASKADLSEAKAELKADLSELRAELKADLSELRAELKADIERTEHRLDMKIVALQSDLRLVEQRMTIRLGGMMVVGVGILLAAIRYLPPHP